MDISMEVTCILDSTAIYLTVFQMSGSKQPSALANRKRTTFRSGGLIGNRDQTAERNPLNFCCMGIFLELTNKFQGNWRKKIYRTWSLKKQWGLFLLKIIMVGRWNFPGFGLFFFGGGALAVSFRAHSDDSCPWSELELFIDIPPGFKIHVSNKKNWLFR